MVSNLQKLSLRSVARRHRVPDKVCSQIESHLANVAVGNTHPATESAARIMGVTGLLTGIGLGITLSSLIWFLVTSKLAALALFGLSAYLTAKASSDAARYWVSKIWPMAAEMDVIMNESADE